MKETVAINQYIRAQELRVIGQDDANLGVISRDDALKIAEEAGLDLIEISPKAVPPVAKIMDYGKFQYAQQKKHREIKAKSHITETKTIQIKVGTGSHDLNLKAKRISEWLQEGHRVRVDLFLRGRYKYMDEKFLKSHIEGFLKLVTEDYKIADVIKKSPKGLSTTIERGKKSSGN
ncbi:translation initiation factor IF-3 [Patescibacteria group bacterium]|nr:translation initiation factor IF-3 [Patescibacteria group bacterium]